MCDSCEPGVAAWDAGRGLASDDRHRLTLRDLWTGKGGSAPSQLHRPAGLSSAAGRCRRNRRRGWHDCARAGPTRPGRSQLPAGDGGASATPVPRERSRCGPTASMPTPSLPSDSQDGCTLLHHHPTAPPTAQSFIEAIPETDWTPIPYWTDGAALRPGRDHSTLPSQSTRRRTSAPHRPQGEAHARLPTGAVHQAPTDGFSRTERATPSNWKPTTAGGGERQTLRRLNHLPSCRQRPWLAVQVISQWLLESDWKNEPCAERLTRSARASSPALALGNTVRPRSGQTANHSVTELTADGAATTAQIHSDPSHPQTREPDCEYPLLLTDSSTSPDNRDCWASIGVQHHDRGPSERSSVGIIPAPPCRVLSPTLHAEMPRLFGGLMFKGALYKNFKFAQNVTLERRLAQKLGVHVQGISSLAVAAI